MILCDIGNTHYHFNIDGRTFSEKELSIKNKKVYYISVDEKKEKILQKKNDAISLKKFVKFDTSYIGLGIDRVMACKSVDTGLVVDAGSAITIDVMSGGIHIGGLIMPGIMAFRETFKNISPVLDVDFNMNVDINVMPTSTKEAVSYGAMGSVIAVIERLAKDKKIYFTGGDGEYLSRYFKNGVYLKNLVFEGMKKTIEESNL